MTQQSILNQTKQKSANAIGLMREKGVEVVMSRMNKLIFFFKSEKMKLRVKLIMILILVLLNSIVQKTTKLTHWS